MTRIRAFLTFVLMAALATAATSQGIRQGGRFTVPLAADYDLDSTSYIFLRTVGESGLPFGRAITRGVKVKTVGASTSIAAVTASSAPFAINSAPPTGGGGDILLFDLKGQPDAATPANIQGTTRIVSRAILTKPDNDNVTVDTAINLSNEATFFTRLFQSGTTTSDGWIEVADLSASTFAWQIKQSDGASVDVTVECEPFSSTDNPAASRIQVFTKNVTVYGCPSIAADTACGSFTLQPSSITAPLGFDRCRLGFKITTDTSDVGAALEKISAQFIGLR